MSYYRSAPPPRGFGGGGLALPPFTPAIRGIVIACAAVYLVEVIARLADQSSGWIYENLGFTRHWPWFSQLFGLSAWSVLHRGFLWQPFTYMWVHSLDPMHLVFNMLSLWLLGGELERHWGSRRFLVYYLVCGVGAAPFIVGADLYPVRIPPTVGASGAIFGIIVAFGVVFAERVIYLMALFPIKARTFAMIMFAVAFLSMLTQAQGGVSNIAHLGGMLVGWLYLKRVWRLPDVYRELRWRLRRRRFKVMDSRDDNRFIH